MAAGPHGENRSTFNSLILQSPVPISPFLLFRYNQRADEARSETQKHWIKFVGDYTLGDSGLDLYIRVDLRKLPRFRSRTGIA
jgi:hypothetical protein